MDEKKKGKVLSFQQDGDFFLRRGHSKLDENKLLDAVASYRKALRLDPQNAEIKLALAESLSEMYHYEESNRLLFSFFGGTLDVLSEEDKLAAEAKIPTECYYGMGVNFMGLREYEQARANFEKYLDLDPDGEFIYDAYDMLDAMDEHEEEILKEQEARLRDSRELLLKENIDDAIAELERVLQEDPEDPEIRNHLSLAYYCKRDFDKARALCEEVLKKDRNNLQAHCNLAIFAHGQKDETGEKRQGDILAAAKTQDPDTMNRVALTLTELERYSDALPFFRELCSISPYDPGTTHRLALCLYETGEYRQARDCYERLLKLNSMDSVALYYRNRCRQAMEGEKLDIPFNIHYEVPAVEAVERVSRIRELVSGEREELTERWEREDNELMLLVHWTLDNAEENIKRAMLHLVGSFRDERAERILREFLLRDQEDPRLKNEIFGILKQCGAQEPYLACIDGRLLEGRVNVVELPEKPIPRAYSHVIEYCITLLRDERPETCMQKAVQIWAVYLQSLKGDYPRLSRDQVFAMAAALEYRACLMANENAGKKEICQKYGVGSIRFENALKKLEAAELEE